MSEKDKKILEAIAKAIPTMSDFNKGRLLGMGEALADKKKDANKDDKEKKAG